MKGITGIISANQPPVMRYAARNSKFAAEKVCAQNDRFLIHFDGILLNYAKPGCVDERFELLAELYARNGASLSAAVRGQFDLALWDKSSGQVLITNDLLSKRSLYYCCFENRLYYAASYYDLLDLLAADGFQPAISEKAVGDMVSSGALKGDMTYVEGVHYLDAFQAIVYDTNTGKMEIAGVTPPKTRTASAMDEAIQIFDELFENAVESQFWKNAEYGYEDFIALSGGMDSRACLLKAVAGGRRSGITCVTYSQSGSIDYTVSQQLAFDNGLDYLFYPMDAAVFMNRLSAAMDLNECQQSSIGSTGAGTLARLLDKTRMGIMHVGLCGGELMGDLVSRDFKGRAQKLLAMLGLTGGGDCHFSMRDYLNNARACQNFSSMFLPECETVSPFLHEDVVMFVTGLDPKLLYRRELYRKWMMRFIPNSYPTTMFCGPVGISPVREIMNKIADRLTRRLTGASRRDMNPIEVWFRRHPALAEKCEAEYNTGMQLLSARLVSGRVMGLLKNAWQTDCEHRLFALTALRAVEDILTRFG